MPRPSSPVCAKASTNCPYLTLESPHHQHQRWRRPLRAGSLGMASSGISVRVLNLSQISVNCQHLARHRTSRSRASLKADTFTASILRTHSQCQTRRPSGTLTAASQAADLVSSSIWYKKEWWSLSGSNRRPDACKATALPAELKPLTHFARRQSQPSCALMARYAALAVLRDVRCSVAAASHPLRNGGPSRS